MIILILLIVLTIYLIPTYIKPRVFHNILTPDERRHIIDKASNLLKPSTISGNGTLDLGYRKSETAWLYPSDPVVRGVIEKCLKYVVRPFENFEQLQVLKYTPGGYYNEHFDDLDGEDNVRMYTFIFALNDDYEGGETIFPNLGLQYKLNSGDALLFDILDNYELRTPKALHAGRAVKSGEKWVCNLWVRKYPYLVKD